MIPTSRCCAFTDTIDTAYSIKMMRMRVEADQWRRQATHVKKQHQPHDRAIPFLERHIHGLPNGPQLLSIYPRLIPSN